MSEGTIKPPVLATAILNFFSNQPDFVALAGDLEEEFRQRAAASGEPVARRWYRREARRNAWALTFRELRRSPGRTLLAAVISMLAMNLATGLLFASYLWRLSDIYTLLSEAHWRELLLAVQVVAPFSVGWLAAKLLPSREWALALTFTGMYVCFETAVFVYFGKVSIPGWLFTLAIWANTLRAIFFAAGCLWARRARLRAVQER